MRALDLFSAAAGGWSLGLHRAGFETVAACEFIDWRRALYLQNNPGVRMYDDVRTLTADQLLRDLGFLPDIVVGSPPCQDISSANTKGKGVEGDRSGLFFEAIRIIGEIRDLGRERGESAARWIALENSSNLRTRGADAVLAALEAIGYTCWAFVVRASDIGANHERPRSWIIGCDLAQVADAAEVGRQPWAGNREGFDGRDNRRLPGYDTGNGQAAGYASQVGRGQGFPRGRAGAVAGAEQQTCRDAAHADRHGEHASSLNGEMAELRRMGPDSQSATLDASGIGHESGRARRHGTDGHGTPSIAEGAGNTPHADETGQEAGLLESSLRPAQVTDDGRSAGWGTDGQSPGEVGVRQTDRLDAIGRRADWSLNDLADHLRMDAGLSAWVAQSRIAVGGPRGTSAASLIVEAFGDSVVPQIPESIGRAIMRTEAALSAIYGRQAA